MSKYIDAIAATLFKKPVGYVKSDPLHRYDKLPDSENWRKKSFLSPLAKKAYMTGNPQGPHQLTEKDKAAEIKSRKDYHEASHHFHQGKIDSLLKHHAPKGSPISQQIQFHTLAAMHHRNAMETNDPNDKFHSAYPKHLENIQKNYSAMEKHAAENKMQTGTGHTRFITKG